MSISPETSAGTIRKMSVSAEVRGKPGAAGAHTPPPRESVPENKTAKKEVKGTGGPEDVFGVPGPCLKPPDSSIS